MLTPKDEREREMFTQFAATVRLAVDAGSLRSCVPPEPDVAFTISGVCQYAELVEITDQSLAHRQAVSLRTREVTGGSFSQVGPLVSAFQSKSGKSYELGGKPLMLVAYYDKQYPADSVDPDMIPREVGGLAAEMVASGTWTKIWVYDSWEKRVLWSYP